MLNTDILTEKGIRSGIFKIEAFEKDHKTGLFTLPVKDMFQEFKNAYVNAGGAIIEDLIIGAAVTNFSNANAYLGVGDSSTAVSAAHTDLQAATNKLRKAMDSTFPSRASQVLTFKSTFATGDANWQWNEVAIFNASSSGTMLCRALVASPFTKTSALAITLSYTLTIP